MKLIKSITPFSIAEEMEISPGDYLKSIDNKPIKDVFDYKMLLLSDFISIQIQKPDGELWDLEIGKEEDEDIGLEFETFLMDKPMTCVNKCIFCFIDQQPPGLRGSLYVKDDDPRLSFLHGNYVTLSNVTVDEVKRIARHHLSPVKVSIHSTNITLRNKIMNCNSSDLKTKLKILAEAGTELHFQVVLCKSYNDGDELDSTIQDLYELQGDSLTESSLAVVPAGLTKYRDGLPLIEDFNEKEAQDVIKQVNKWQKYFFEKSGSRFVFLADEWYIKGNVPIPDIEEYENFTQLDNGVGMIRLFEDDFMEALQGDSSELSGKIGIITAYASYGLMKRLAKAVMDKNPKYKIKVFPVENKFFGEKVTVSGLLTGKDILDELKEKELPEIIFAPGNAFNEGVMPDGVTLQELSDALGVSIITADINGSEFYESLRKNNAAPDFIPKNK